MVSNKRVGTGFENHLIGVCHRQYVAVTRIEDGCFRAGKRLIPRKQDCDFVLTYKGRSALIDAKSQLDGQTFAKGNVNPDQIDAMSNHYRAGAIAGYIVYFRAMNKIIFLSVDKIHLDLRNINDGVELGHIEDWDIRKLWR